MEEVVKVEKALNNLMEAELIRSDPKTNSINKYPKLMKIHEQYEEFAKDYEIVKEYILGNNKNKSILSQLENTVEKINFFFTCSTAQKGKKLYYSELYHENPLVAEKLVREFIEDENNDNISSYIYSKHMTILQFSVALSIVKKENRELYETYNDKIKCLEETKYDRFYNRLLEIAKGIETGYLSDGTRFDEFQFWKLIPFMYSKGINNDFIRFREKNPNIGRIKADSFYSRVSAFVEGAMPEKANIILNYMRANRMFSYTYISFAAYKRLHSGRKINLRIMQSTSSTEDIFSEAYKKGYPKKLFDTFYVTEEIQNEILTEILEKGLPHIIEVYYLLEKKYMEENVINLGIYSSTNTSDERVETIPDDNLCSKQQKKVCLTKRAQAMLKKA